MNTKYYTYECIKTKGEELTHYKGIIPEKGDSFWFGELQDFVDKLKNQGYYVDADATNNDSLVILVADEDSEDFDTMFYFKLILTDEDEIRRLAREFFD